MDDAMRQRRRAVMRREYVTTALWVELDDHGTSLAERFDIDDIHPDALIDMYGDMDAFVQGCEVHRPGCLDRLTARQVAHDFWLTRCGHGAGFWDRGLGELGDWLTQQAKPYGEAALYVGDDGLLHYHG